MIYMRVICVFLCLLGLSSVKAQDNDLQMGHLLYDYIDHLDIAGANVSTFSKPLSMDYLAKRQAAGSAGDAAHGRIHQAGAPSA